MTVQAALLLLADSRLLFQPDALPQVRRQLAGRTLQAAYIGAANGHQPEFYELACAGLEALLGGPVPCAFVRSAGDIPAAPVNLLLLAGGSVSAGWAFLQQPEMEAWVRDVLHDPQAVVIGISAGAIHLARGCDPALPVPQARIFLDGLPHFIAVHEEHQGWPSRQVWQAGGAAGEFIPLPLGGGLWYCQGERRPVGAADLSA